MVGICLIRLKKVRPTSFPSWLGISSENAAHRTAVEWDDHGVVREGVYVRRRDTNSWLNSLAGGRVFPGIHYHAMQRQYLRFNSDSPQLCTLTGNRSFHEPLALARKR